MKHITSLLIMQLMFLPVFSDGKDTTIVEGLYYRDKEPVSVKMVNGRIVEIQHLLEKKDAPMLFIVPGLIDIQINGYMGVDFGGKDLTLDGTRKATMELWKEGVASFLPTLITNDNETYKRNFKVLA